MFAEVKMGVQKIAIICDGKQINYGLNLYHLMRYKDEKENFYSRKADNFSIEIYSKVVFQRNSSIKKAIKIFVGDTWNEDLSFKCVFKRYGMLIYKSELGYILKVDINQLNSKEYEEFIAYANSRREEYFCLEKSYVEQVKELDDNWITSEFTQSALTGFGSKKNKKVQQLYDCIAFVWYLDFLNKTKEVLV